MEKRRVLLVAAVVVWVLASWQWYTCDIKGFCGTEGVYPAMCPPYLTTDITRGGHNSPAEVRRLQQFLNTFEGEALPVNGIYGMNEATAVERFQWKYRDDVLAPWGETVPTARVLTTTRNAVNAIICAQTGVGVVPSDYTSNATGPMLTQLPAATQAYTVHDATWEILIMLLGAFIFGWLVRHLFGAEPLSQLTHVAPVSPAPTRSPITVAPVAREDDLKIVEGIGPKIETLLKTNGVKNWNDLASASPAHLREVLARGGDRFALAVPDTWPEQAQLARDGKWEELKEYKAFLYAGRA
jgi:predicted flap endonuclease-1-like 5' DNA nuclease